MFKVNEYYDGKVKSAEQLYNTMKELLSNEQKFKAAAVRCKEYMLENTGATEKIMAGLRTYL